MKELDFVKDAYNEYQNYAGEKAKAEKAHKLHIAALRAQIAEDNETFKETWKERKETVKENLDNAALLAFAEGTSPHALLAAIGSRNVTWAYALKNSGESAAVKDTSEAPKVHPLVAGATWEHSNHTGTHGVLRSDNGLFKLYDLTDGETFIIVDNNLELVTGSKTFYDAYSKPEMERLTHLLSTILDGTHTGPVRVANNRYTS